MFLMMQNSSTGIYKTKSADVFNEENEEKMLPSEYLHFYKSVILQVFMEKLCQIIGRILW